MGQDKWGTMDTVSRSQPRQNFNEKEMASLAESLREHGQQQPIVVRRAPHVRGADRVAEYGIINGERRWRALKRIGATEILVRVVKADTRSAYRLAVINDIHNVSHNSLERGQSLIECEEDMREELTEFLAKHLPLALEQPLSQAGYERLQKVEHLTPLWMRKVFERALKTKRQPKVIDEDVAATVGITTKRMQDLTKLTTLETEFKTALEEDQINTRHAGALLRLPDKKARKKLYKMILDDGLSGVDAEQRAKDMLEPIQKIGGTWKIKAADPMVPMRAALSSVEEAAKVLRETDAPENRDELRQMSAQMLELLAEIESRLA
jgi:ParB-like chromosome segregation protein Spo0J